MRPTNKTFSPRLMLLLILAVALLPQLICSCGSSKKTQMTNIGTVDSARLVWSDATRAERKDSSYSHAEKSKSETQVTFQLARLDPDDSIDTVSNRNNIYKVYVGPSGAMEFDLGKNKVASINIKHISSQATKDSGAVITALATRNINSDSSGVRKAIEQTTTVVKKKNGFPIRSMVMIFLLIALPISLFIYIHRKDK